MSNEVREDARLRRNPPHPGGLIRYGWLESNNYDYEGMTVGAAARKPGVSRESLSRVINGRAAISIELALKLEAAGWAAADVWLEWQSAYDLARARNRKGQWPAGDASAESGDRLENAHRLTQKQSMDGHRAAA